MSKFAGLCRAVALAIFLSCIAAWGAAPAGAQSALDLPVCVAAGQTGSLDLSTVLSWNLKSTAMTVQVDPHWTVNGGPAYQTAPAGAWKSVANWIQPYAASTPHNYGKKSGGIYRYKIQFTIPCDPANYTNISLSGSYLADDLVTSFTLNTTAGPVCNSSSGCFKTATAFSFGAGALKRGLNTMTVAVTNNAGYEPNFTGLALTAHLASTCGSKCAPGGPLVLQKVLVDPNHLVAAGTTFPIIATCKTPWAATTVQSLDVRANATFPVQAIYNLELGSKCFMTEKLPPPPPGCTWKPPVFAPGDVTLNTGGSGWTLVKVTNAYSCPPPCTNCVPGSTPEPQSVRPAGECRPGTRRDASGACVKDQGARN